MVRIDQSSFRRSLRSSGVLRCVSVSQMKERNDRDGGFSSASAMAFRDGGSTTTMAGLDGGVDLVRMKIMRA